MQEVILKAEFNKTQEILQMVNTLESQSTHPVATAIHNYVKVDNNIKLENVKK